MDQILLQQAAEISALLQQICQYYSQSGIGQLIYKEFGRIFKEQELILGRRGLVWSPAWLNCFISQQSPAALRYVAFDELVPAPGHEAIFCKL